MPSNFSFKGYFPGGQLLFLLSTRNYTVKPTQLNDIIELRKCMECSIRIGLNKCYAVGKDGGSLA